MEEKILTANRLPLKPMRRVLVSDEIIEQFKNLILDGTLKPGDGIGSETNLAAQMNVGRSTIREALKVLIHLGFIERKGKVAIVSECVLGGINPRDIVERFRAIRNFLEMIEVRKIIEPDIAAMAATRHDAGDLDLILQDVGAMQELIGVLDLNLHEIGDRYVGGLHGAIRGDRLEAAGDAGIPQFVVPGNINYMVLGPLESLSPEMRTRKLIVHNSYLTLVRLSHEELRGVGKLVAEKLNRARGVTRVFIPLQGYSFPDRRSLPHWDPEGNQVFVQALKADLNPEIPLVELDAHINDPEFIDPVVEEFLSVMTTTI